MQTPERRAAQPAAEPDLPELRDVLAAAQRLYGRVLRTPVLQSAAIDTLCGRRLHFKCENLQYGGAFKYRGALNAVLQLAQHPGPSLIATHSSGNHGLAVALAARAEGRSALVVMPDNSSAAKLARVRAAGAEVVLCSPGTAAREARLAGILSDRAAQVVHPFDDSRVIAGQGTAALELLADRPQLDAVVAPVGGGGLIGGTALAVRGLLPQCRVFAAEPELADDAYRSFVGGVRQGAGIPTTIADGLRGSIGVRNFALLRRLVDQVVLVSEAEIVAAMRLALDELKLLIEPSAAVALAAVVTGRVGREGDAIGVILSGGNVDLQQCPFLAGAR